MFKLSTVYTSWLQRLHQTILAHSAQPGCGAALDQAFYFRITLATRSVAGHFAQQLMTGSPVKRRVSQADWSASCAASNARQTDCSRLDRKGSIHTSVACISVLVEARPKSRPLVDRLRRKTQRSRMMNVL